MLRWIMISVGISAFGVVFTTTSVAVLGMSLVVAIVALCVSVLSFISDRVSVVSEGQSVREVELLVTARGRRQQQPAQDSQMGLMN